MHAGQHRLGHLGEQLHGLVQRTDQRVGGFHRRGAHRRQVAAGHEGTAVATEHDDAHGAVAGQRLAGFQQRMGQIDTQGIEHVRTVEAQVGDGPAALDEQR
ncbi:hypothetical protein D3C81_1581340 [compost metagenome]